MTEPVEELQEGVLRARSDRVITSTVSGELYEDNRDTEDDYASLCQKLYELLEDIKACDAQLCLFVAATSSYRHDTTLRPFPPMFLKNGEKDIEALTSSLKSLPTLSILKRDLRLGKLELDLELLKLIVWVLDGGNSKLKLKSLSDEASRSIASLRKFENHPHPHYIFEVNTNASSRWKVKVEGSKTLWAFHGSRLDNFYSILNYGLQQHLNKTGLFGEGIYLCEDLGVCLSYSSQGLGWSGSSLGTNVSCVVLTQVLDHPSVKLYSEDRARGSVEGSVGGRVPDKYVLVRNNELAHIRYLLMYKHTAPASGVAGASQSVNNNPIATFISNNKIVVLHLAYILLLAFIGLSNSVWFQRWLRKRGWVND